MKSPEQAYDVIVAGGGFAGYGAAVQSARRGLKTLLVEKNSQWGGIAREGMHQFLCGLYLSGENFEYPVLNSGLSEEVTELLVSRGQAETVKAGKMTVLQYEPEAVQKIFTELAGKEMKLSLLFEAKVEDVDAGSGLIERVRVRHENQFFNIACRSVIDCSGSGEVIRKSGASYEIASAGERQLAAYACSIEGVKNGAEMPDLKIAYCLAQAAAAGQLAPHLKFSIWMPDKKNGRGTLRVSVLPVDSEYDIQEIRKQAEQVHAVLKKAMPEFVNSKVLHLTEHIVEREGLRMLGRYTLTKNDVLTAKKFADGVVKSAWPVEFWNQKTGPRYDYLKDGECYEIPARCLQSKDISNLFCAGKCISADAQALASARVTGTCLALGEQAANSAAAYIGKEPVENLNFVDIIREETKNYRSRTALRQGTKSISYEGLFQNIERLAGKLKELPFKKYARTGLLVREGIDYVISNLAVLSLQAVIVPIPQNSTQDEINQIIRDIKLDALIFEKSLYDTGEESITFPSAFHGRAFSVIFFPAEMREQNEFKSLNPAFIRFTSGTTGQSKGVVISHQSIKERTEAADQALKITHNDVVIWVLSMSYHFIVTTLLFLRRGAAIVFCEHEIPKGLIEGLSAGDATFIYAAPMHYQAMARVSEFHPAQCTHVRKAVSTTVHLSAQTAREFSEKFGFELNTAYGVIELGLPFVNDSGLAEKCQSVGKLLPQYECRLVKQDKDGVGIVQIKGPGMFDAYFSPWKTRDQITVEGWFETGDLGRFDEQGFLYLLGRHQQVINFMGMKIFPREIEEVLQQNPAIDQAYVYGEEHSVYGQMPCAKIVFKTESTDFNEDALRQFCYARLPSYKVPKKFELVRSLKKTMSGKVKVDQ